MKTLPGHSMGKTSFSPSFPRAYRHDHHSKHHVIRACAKRSSHAHYRPIRHLSAEHFPEEVRTASALKLVRDLAQLVVRVRVMLGSQGGGASGRRRISTARTCTGVVTSMGKDYLQVMVPLHAVKNDVEALHTNADFFFDSEDDRDVVTVRGLSLTRNNHHHTAHLTCRTCPELGQLLQQFKEDKMASALSLRELADVELVRRLDSSVAVLISHPHGFSKKVSFGSFCGEDVRPGTHADSAESSGVEQDTEGSWMLSSQKWSSVSEADVTAVSLQPLSYIKISSSTSSLVLDVENVEDEKLLVCDNKSSNALFLSKSQEDNIEDVPVRSDLKPELGNTVVSESAAEVWNRILSLCSAFYRLVGSLVQGVLDFPQDVSHQMVSIRHSAPSCPGSSGGAVLVIGRRVWAGLGETVTSLPVFLHIGVMGDKGVAVPVVNSKALCHCFG